MSTGSAMTTEEMRLHRMSGDNEGRNLAADDGGAAKYLFC